MKEEEKSNPVHCDVELAFEVLKVGGWDQVRVEQHHSLHKVQAQRAAGRQQAQNHHRHAGPSAAQSLHSRVQFVLCFHAKQANHLAARRLEVASQQLTHPHRPAVHEE